MGFRPEEMNDILRRELTAAFAGLEFYDFKQFGEIQGGLDADAVVEALPRLLSIRQIDAAIVGIGA
jgi:hypothetical protein